MHRTSDAGEWFPLSEPQKARWFRYRLAPERQGEHNIAMALRLTGEMELSSIHSSLDMLTARHPMLRAELSEVNGEPGQRIRSAVVPLLEWTNASELDEAALRQRVEVFATSSFGDSPAAWIRAHVFQTGASERVLVVVVDHSVCDGWSWWILLDELARSLAGKPLPVRSDPPARYADYVAWQRLWLASDEASRRRCQIVENVGRSLAPISWKGPDGHHAADTRRGAVNFTIEGSHREALATLVRRQSGSTFSALLCVYQALLHRLTGAGEIAVAAPVPARGDGDWDDVVGDFVNLVILRADWSDNPPVEEALRRMRSVSSKGLASQDYPFTRVVEDTAHNRAGVSSALYHAGYLFQKDRTGSEMSRVFGAVTGASESMVWGSCRAIPFELSHVGGGDGSDTPLVLEALDGGGRLACRFLYSLALIDGAAVHRMATQLVALLHAMAEADGATRVGDLDVMDAAQRRQVLIDFNATATPFPQDLLVHQLFEARVRERPNDVAVAFDGQCLSYADLNARANQLAHHLLGLGIGPDCRVAVCVERSVEMVVALMGVLKAGAAYVPLDPAYPAERLRYMLDDSAAVALLTQRALVGLVPRNDACPCIVLDEPSTWQGEASHDPDAAALGLKPSHLAYVIFTSGSTGQPKGVMNEHAGVVNRLLWAQSRFQLDSHDRVIQKTPFGFDVSVWEFFWPLAVGARLVVAPPGLHQDAQGLAAFIAREGITIAHFVPSMLGPYLEHATHARPPALRRVLCSGEALPASMQHRFFETLAGVELHNLYGPTEAAVDVTHWQCQPGDGRSSVPIGRPVANTQIYILDARLQPVPVGVTGEIFIGGVQVARGYVNQPALTRERFLPDPFGTEPGARLYRTGDLARWLTDGSVDYLGRVDFQVKLRGMRIELGEIEAALTTHPGIREAAVILREDTPGDVRLTAYLVADANARPTPQALRQALATRLPEHMVPAAFVMLDALPVGPNGKLARSALPRPDRAAVATHDYEAPVGPVEEALAQVWCDLLHVKRVGRRDDFFALGGHSLFAAQLAMRARQLFDVDVPLRHVFQWPVLWELADQIVELQLAGYSEAELALAIAEVDMLSGEEVSQLAGGALS